MVTFLRKILCVLTALFWSNRSKWFTGLATSFWAIQHIACAYGPDDGREAAEFCDPKYDIDRLAEPSFSSDNYTECEKTLTEALIYEGKCAEPCQNYEYIPVASPMDSTKTVIETLCLDEGHPDCSVIALSNNGNVIRSVELACGDTTGFKNMIADSLITGFKCDGKDVSVEEGLQRGHFGSY